MTWSLKLAETAERLIFTGSRFLSVEHEIHGNNSKYIYHNTIHYILVHIRTGNRTVFRNSMTAVFCFIVSL